jgi:competence protein ComGC
MNRRDLLRLPTGAFTLVELLIVITIITILIMIFIPIYTGTKAGIDRMHCALNLSNCHKIIIQYASNNNSCLPNFSGGYFSGLDAGILEDYSVTSTQFPMVNELKRYGANASIFTCPATPAWQNTADTLGCKCPPWCSWDPTLNPPNGFARSTPNSTSFKTVYTFGYCFMNRGSGFFHDNRAMPQKSSDSGDLPLGADLMYYYGNVWGGFYHEPGMHAGDPNIIYGVNGQTDTSKLVSITGSVAASNGLTVGPGYPAVGGGNVVFLSGNCQWFDFGTDIMPGVTAGPTQQQPMWAVYQGTAASPFVESAWYFFGRLPLNAGSKMN